MLFNKLALVVCTCCAVAATAQHVVLVGSAGCDGDDHTCKEGSSEDERFMRPLMVADNGSMALIGTQGLPIFSIDAGGMPAWIATNKDCVFATLPASSKVFSMVQKPGKVVTRTQFNPDHSVQSGGVNPVFAAPTVDGNVLLVANYHGPDNANSSTGAFVTSFKIGEQCQLTLVDTLPHSGSSINPQRQGGAHPHSFVPVRDNIAYACDLGMDTIFAYSVSAEGKLSELSRTKVAPGSGPRHLVQHPKVPVVYVVTEMGQTVTVYEQADNGALKLLQTESLNIASLSKGDSKSAEIAISPCGSYVYATNRGAQNTVTAFQVVEYGKLSRLSYVEAPAFPRGMELIGKEGNILLVGGQSKTEVWSYLIGKDGKPVLAAKLGAASPDPGNPGAPISLPPHPATFAEVNFGGFGDFAATGFTERQLLV